MVSVILPKNMEDQSIKNALHTTIGQKSDTTQQSEICALKLAQYIDHTLLKKDATENDIQKLCNEAVEYSFKAICVDRKWISIAKRTLNNNKVLVATVISFPSGKASLAEKSGEAIEALQLGADELDLVLNRQYLHEKKYYEAFLELKTIVDTGQGLVVKVILETSELSYEEKVIACALAKAAGASFVKTSTGYSKSGATLDDVKLMREIVGSDFGVKASGGIRGYTDALLMIEAGANRLGTSASVAIMKEATKKGNGKCE